MCNAVVVVTIWGESVIYRSGVVYVVCITICTNINVVFVIPTLSQGLVPDMAISVTLRELISIDVAKELTMTARMFTGLEAKEYGLVTK